VEEAMEIEKVVKDTRKIVMVEHMKRYSTAYKRAMDIVNSKDFWSIVMIESKMHGRPYVSLFNCLIEWQIHNIDIVRAFGGDVKNLKAVKKQIAENRAAIAVLLEFENGVVGTLNWGTEGGFGRYCERLEIVGSNWKGVIVENTRDVIYYDHNIGQVWRPDWQPVHDNFIHALDGYVGIIGKFIECINTRKQAGPTATDERKNLEIIHEIRKQLNIPFDWRYTPSEF
jgi:predicted dehydrogenase